MLLLFTSGFLGACGGISVEPDGCWAEGLMRRGGLQQRWSPESFGAVARWSADARFATLASSGAGVARLRNHINGRSGVLVQTDTALDPTWVTARGVSCRPAIYFDGTASNRLDEESSGLPDGSRASDIDSFSGTNKPFTVLMTTQLTTAVSAHTLAVWYSLLSANPLIQLEVTSADLLKLTRRDDSGTFANLTGTIELGTSIRRIGATFDGSSFVLWLDAQQDNSTSAAGGQGAITLGKYRVGLDSGAANGADMYLRDLVLLPRAIGRNEWLHYYEWSVKQWGKIQPPQFGASGIVSEGTGDLDLNYPNPSAGDRIFAVIGVRNIVSTPAQPVGWTNVYGPDTNPNASIFLYERDAVATGSEGTTKALFTISAGNNANLGYMFTMKGVSNTAAITGHYESATTTEVDGPGTLSAPTIRPNGYGRLAVIVCGIDEASLVDFTGATGGTWSRVANATTTVGNNFGLSVHVATMNDNGIGPITGGGFAIGGSNSAICRGFALVGE